MRPGWTLVANKETKPTDSEQVVLRAVLRDCHVTSIGEWLITQKPKIRIKFMKFLQSVRSSTPPADPSVHSTDIAERFARDILQTDFHSVIRTVLDQSDGEYSDVLHILSLHMERSNVMASIPSIRDRTPQLFKAIAQEDHVYSRPSVARHELPKVATARENGRPAAVNRTDAQFQTNLGREVDAVRNVSNRGPDSKYVALAVRELSCEGKNATIWGVQCFERSNMSLSKTVCLSRSLSVVCV
jgi:hypothetical protein